MKEQIISFETAKLAKEKGFKELCLCYYFEDSEFKEHNYNGTYGYYGDEFTIEYEDLLENWNSEFLTKKNGVRCFGCSKDRGYYETFSAPTQSLLQKWFREKHKIWVLVDFQGAELCWSKIVTNKTDKILNIHPTYELALEEGLKEALTLI